MKTYTHKRKTYKLSNVDEIVNLNAVLRSELNNNIASMVPLAGTLDLKDISLNDYYVVKTSATGIYYINKQVINGITPTVANLKMIVKCAFSEIKNHNPDIRSPAFVHFIYSKCKYLKFRNLPSTTLDSLDRFAIGSETKTKTKVTSIRHNGTRVGASAKANCPINKEIQSARRSKARNSNIEFIRGLMYGFKFKYRPLFDTYERCDMENKTLDSNYDCAKSIFTLHHALVFNGTSVNKNNKEPSAILSVAYDTISADSVNELLGCIALSANSHGLVHKTHQYDDIDNWINRYKTGKCVWIPYHWQSKKKYDKTTKWLVKNVVDYTKDDVLSYKDFIKSVSFTKQHKKTIKAIVAKTGKTVNPAVPIALAPLTTFDIMFSKT